MGASLTHLPAPECDHLWGNWQPIIERVGDDEVFRHWTRTCYTCRLVEEWGQTETPEDDRP